MNEVVRRVRRLNAQDHARAVSARASLVRAFVAANAGANYRAILDAMPGKRTNTGEALRRLVDRGELHNIGRPTRNESAYVVSGVVFTSQGGSMGLLATFHKPVPEERPTPREQALAAIAADAQEVNAQWQAWGTRLRATLEVLDQLMQERGPLLRRSEQLERRARNASVKHRGDMTVFQAECATDYMDCVRVIGGRLVAYYGGDVTEVGVSRPAIELLEQALAERAAAVKRIRDCAEDHAELRRERGPELRVEQPGYGVYRNISHLPPSTGGRGNARFSHEPPPEETES